MPIINRECEFNKKYHTNNKILYMKLSKTLNKNHTEIYLYKS